jgi:siroheme decarboxylase
MSDSMEFSAAERMILAHVQGDLPDSATPFAELAAEAGISEAEAIGLLTSLVEQGIIRRFGATLRHQKAGYGANTMVAWLVDQDKDIDEVGRILASRPEITHCYRRRTLPEWPYNLYTMVHGKTRDDCLRAVLELSEATGVERFELLFSHRELKKTSMRYF